MNWAYFVVLALSICNVVTLSSANRPADRFGDECSNLKVLSVQDLWGAAGEMPGLFMTRCRVRVQIHKLYRLPSAKRVLGAIRSFG
jgi:hypothetical protein